MTVQTISPHQVISGNCGRGRHLGMPDEAAWIMEESDRLALAGDPLASPEVPRYAKIGDLPLYVALEGKNRVALFRAASRPMHVFVTPTLFPPPSELTIERIWPGNFLALIYGDRRALLPEPEAVAVLEAYGVKRADRRRFDWRARRSMRAIRDRLASSMMEL